MTGPVPHGTPSGYVRCKCRCDLCREAEVQRQREWRQRHRDGKVRHRTDHPSCVPVRVRGVVYPSISAAAYALNVTPSSIAGQLARRGAADGAGLGGHAPRRRPQPVNSRRCVIHGREFPSIAAAAREIGVNYSHFFREVKRGLSDQYSQYLLLKMMQADAGRQGRAA
ncbi:hypothetical protein [Paracoccus hibiscisoli]|uniref:Uncharacterized protein n=1 Tax=Paracoccus hibiscisoli TaxID=2023261 RepID=A0A4U0QVD6_9RHOB|nr:hypothetical protein [Paracoccus hibiscisoli]TJZ86143.1 hypothetical protein FA740_04450 [Paracoccus hibiscisoli]